MRVHRLGRERAGNLAGWLVQFETPIRESPHPNPHSVKRIYRQKMTCFKSFIFVACLVSCLISLAFAEHFIARKRRSNDEEPTETSFQISRVAYQRSRNYVNNWDSVFQYDDSALGSTAAAAPPPTPTTSGDAPQEQANPEPSDSSSSLDEVGEGDDTSPVGPTGGSGGDEECPEDEGPPARARSGPRRAGTRRAGTRRAGIRRAGTRSATRRAGTRTGVSRTPRRQATTGAKARPKTPSNRSNRPKAIRRTPQRSTTPRRTAQRPRQAAPKAGAKKKF